MHHLSYFDKKVLVTGGAGAIGSRLVRKLSDMGSSIVVIDNLSSGYTWNLSNLNNVLFVYGDITNDIDLKRVFNEKPEIVFHLAAFFANQNSIEHPEQDLYTNGFGTLKLMEHSALAGNIKRFVYTSSGCSVYPFDVPMPLTESISPTMYHMSPYQITKMLGELYGNFYHKMYNLPFTKARLFNSYGPGEVPGRYRNVIPNFIYWAMNKKPLPITGTGEETRDFTYVDDIVDGLIRMGYYEQAIGEEFNLAAGREIKIRYLAETINRFCENEAGIIYTEKRKWDAASRLFASNEKAINLLGVKPDLNFEKGLIKTIDWFKENWNNIVAGAKFGSKHFSAIGNYNKLTI